MAASADRTAAAAATAPAANESLDCTYIYKSFWRFAMSNGLLLSRAVDL